MNILSENIELLRLIGMDFYQHVILEPPLYSELVLESLPSGLRAIKGDAACYVNSIYDIEAEYRWMLRDVDPAAEFLVFIGPISFHTMRFIRKQCKHLYGVFFVEPTNQIFQQTLKRDNLLEMIKTAGKTKAYLLCNMRPDETIRHIVGTFTGGNQIEFVMSPTYQTLFPEYCGELSLKFIEDRKRRMIAIATAAKDSQKFIENTIRNYCRSAIRGESLKNALMGKPLIIVGAGPSLKKNLHLLKGNRQAWIVACGSSIPTLKEWGIKADFHVVYEPRDQSHFLSHEEFSDVPLIFANQTNPNSLDAYKGPKLNIVTNTDHLTKHYFASASESVVVKSGPSVVNIAHDFFCKMGCSPIIFIGQDMCLYDNTLHAMSEKTGSGQEIKYRGDFTQKDIYGNDVETLDGYWSIKFYLEKICKEFPETEFINATEGGLGIDGAANDTLAAVLARIHGENISAMDIVQRLAGHEEKFTGVRIAMIQELGLLEDIKRIWLMVVKISNAVKDLENSKENVLNRGKIKQLLTRTERHNAVLTNDPFYKKVVEPTLHETLSVIAGRYLQAGESNRLEAKIEAAIGKHTETIGEVAKFCQWLGACYQQVLQEYQHNREKEDALHIEMSDVNSQN